MNIQSIAAIAGIVVGVAVAHHLRKKAEERKVKNWTVGQRVPALSPKAREFVADLNRLKAEIRNHVDNAGMLASAVVTARKDLERELARSSADNRCQDPKVKRVLARLQLAYTTFIYTVPQLNALRTTDRTESADKIVANMASRLTEDDLNVYLMVPTAKV